MLSAVNSTNSSSSIEANNTTNVTVNKNQTLVNSTGSLWFSCNYKLIKKK